MECGLCAPLDEEVDADQQVESMGDEDAEESGMRRPTTLSTPYTPSKQERIEHELTHVPYRSWCPHCVRGKAVAMGHDHKSHETEEDREIPVIGLDYAFSEEERQ